MKMELNEIKTRVANAVARKAVLAICSLATTAMVVGCASDPVAQLLKTNGGFAIVRPPSAGDRLGDVHRKKSLSEKSIAMKDVMSDAALQAMMASRAEQVDIPSTSGTKSYAFTAEAAYVGVATADFEAKGARKYRVTVSRPIVYDSPFDSHLSAVLIPTIKSKFPNVALRDKFIVRSLLEVGGLEYEFFKEDGGKINIAADKQLVENLSAKLGAEWKVTEDTKLTITQPRFIGYRLARIVKDDKVDSASPTEPAAPSKKPTKLRIKLSTVPISEYETADLRKIKKIQP